MLGGAPYPLARSLGVLVLVGTCLGTTLGCRKQETPLIRVTLGEGMQFQFRPQAAYAEYLELPGLRNELRITLASFPATCQRYTRPAPDDTLISISLALPAETAPEATQYPSLGGAGIRDAVTKIEQPTAGVYVRRGSTGYSFKAGGVLTLTQLKLGPHGHVAGETSFESPPDSSQPMLHLEGKFAADMCRYQAATE